MKKNISIKDYPNIDFSKIPGTGKVYDELPYLTDTDAQLLAVLPIESDYYLLFDKTVFFPKEGGQSPDKGIISISGQDIEVTDVHIQKADGIEYIFHRVNASVGDFVCGLTSGASATMSIDWSHRYSNMQNHSGEHIFSGLVHKHFGYNNVGFHLSDNSVTMDYNGPLSPEDLAKLEYEANYVIRANFPILCDFPSKEKLESLEYRSKIELEGKVRIVTIPEVDVCACCAPHVFSTCEVGQLIIISSQNYKGGVRISILCGERAYAYIRENKAYLDDLSHKMALPYDKISKEIDKLYTEISGLKAEIFSYQRELLSYKLDKLPHSYADICITPGKTDSRVMRDTINDLKEDRPGYLMILSGTDSSYNYIMGSSDKDCRKVLKELQKELDIKGGGKPEMIQGSITEPMDKIREVLERYSFVII